MGDPRAGRRASLTSRPRTSGLPPVINSLAYGREEAAEEATHPFSRSFGHGSALRGSLRSSIRASRSSLEAGRASSAAAFELDDQAWALKRKKIGLSRRTGRTLVKLSEEEQRQQIRLNFIASSFQRKECVLFQPRSDQPGGVCQCGAAAAGHRNAAVASIAEEEWSAGNAIQEFKTNAFGQVDFVNEDTGSSKPSKYLRLSDTTPISHVLTLLVDHWQLCHPYRPSLVISILGGAKNFRLDGRKKQKFNEGLLKAAKSTNAWLITGAFNMGYMKVIGDTINQGQYLITGEGGKMTRGIRCLGICSWGYVRDKELLINKDVTGFNHASYKATGVVRPHEPVSLNGDHTHFLLVDDGMRNKAAGAAELRSKLEERIADPGLGGLGIPVIVLILEGGLGVIVDVLHSLRRGIPVVVIRGTGRAADIIAAAQYLVSRRNGSRPKFRSSTRKRLGEMLEDAYNKSHRGTKEELYEYIDKLEECMEFVDHINVFDLNSDQELDAVILNALMKDSGITEDSLLPMEPLQLALMWGRLDMAEKIFSGRHDWPSGCLDDMLTDTLLTNKVDFFNLLVLNVVFLKDYLNVRRLRLLYNLAATSRSTLRRAMERLGIGSDSAALHLRHVDALLTHVLRRHEKSLYERDDPRPTHRDTKLDELQFQEPWDELFLWAVLNCRQAVARHVWTRTSSPVTFAVIATAVYRHYHDSTSSGNNHMRDMFSAYFSDFKQLSVELIHLCYEKNSAQAVSLVERRDERLGDMSVALLAMFADNRTFLATPCAYDSIQQTWMGAIRKASTAAICVAIFCPVVVWSRAVRFLPLGDNGGELGPFQKLLAFYKAPCTKLMAHAMSYAAFLVLYTYMILFDFRFELQLTEKIVIFWIFTMCLDAFKQITTYPSETLQGKVSDWIGSIWNKLDFLTFLLTMLSFCLRMFTLTFAYGRIAYSLNTCILYIRAFRFYHIVFKLGPKLVILYRMIDEVFNFMLLLVVFILGYGVAAQALLYPVRPFYLAVFKDVFLLPYWQMYGELQLETAEAPVPEVCYDSERAGQICEDVTHYAQVVPPMLAIFLLFGNVMLLNLLIAVFSNVFEKVRENSMEIWKYEMFRLVKEYEEKPGLAPPLVILELVWIAGKKIWKVCCRRRKENLKVYLKRHLANLVVFERECIAFFLQKEKEAKSNQTDEKLARIEERLTSFTGQSETDMERVEDILMAAERKNERRRGHVTVVPPCSGSSEDEEPLPAGAGRSPPAGPLPLRLPSAHARLAQLERRLTTLQDELTEQRGGTDHLLQQLLTRLPQQQGAAAPWRPSLVASPAPPPPPPRGAGGGGRKTGRDEEG